MFQLLCLINWGFFFLSANCLLTTVAAVPYRQCRPTPLCSELVLSWRKAVTRWMQFTRPWRSLRPLTEVGKQFVSTISLFKYTLSCPISPKSFYKCTSMCPSRNCVEHRPSWNTGAAEPDAQCRPDHPLSWAEKGEQGCPCQRGLQGLSMCLSLFCLFPFFNNLHFR